jgi:uncharacterized protein YidB (DUF937 family)
VRCIRFLEFSLSWFDWLADRDRRADTNIANATPGWAALSGDIKIARLNKLHQGGLGNAANSWVGSGQNQPVSPSQLGQALGPNIIKTLSQMTGLSEDDLTKQLSQGIPVIVNTLTPNGRLPTVAELSDIMEQQ